MATASTPPAPCPSSSEYRPDPEGSGKGPEAGASDKGRPPILPTIAAALDGIAAPFEKLGAAPPAAALRRGAQKAREIDAAVGTAVTAGRSLLGAIADLFPPRAPSPPRPRRPTAPRRGGVR